MENEYFKLGDVWYDIQQRKFEVVKITSYCTYLAYLEGDLSKVKVAYHNNSDLLYMFKTEYFKTVKESLEVQFKRMREKAATVETRIERTKSIYSNINWGD